MKKVFIYSVLSLLAISCLKKIDIDGDSYTPKLVLNGFVSNQDTLRIHVSASKAQLESGEFVAIKDADVRLLDANGTLIETLQLVDNGNESYYYANYMPLIGETYQIEARHGDYENVKAETFVPLPIQNLTFDTLTLPNGSVSLTISFDDAAGIDDRYVVTLYGMYEDYYYNEITMEYDTVIGKWPSSFESYSPYFEGASSSEGYYYGDQFVKDALFDGERVTITLIASDGYEGQIIEVKRASDAYYNHKFSLSNYEFTTGDPFSEPVRVYSNVENGFGIFAGFNASSFAF